jgi:hypothetical protein
MRRYILNNKDIRTTTETLWTYLETLSTFTIYEFATWCGKFSIISALQHGGINPCVRSCCNVGEVAGQNDNDDDDNNKRNNMAIELYQIGQLVLQQFFDRFPLRLSTNIVKRVADMRQTATLAYYNNNRLEH